MAAKQQETQVAQDSQQRLHLDAVIGQQVLLSLGQPTGLLAVQVRRLWEDRYRVNVLVGGDVASTRVAHSYFVIADVGGKILDARPKITKQY
jgi:hypothetical protein